MKNSINNIERIMVPQDKCPLDMLAKANTQNAWMFLHRNAIEWLKKNAITISEWNGFTFNIGGRIVRVGNFSKQWYILVEVIFGEGIHEFNELPENPERIIYVEMA